jgi:DNA-directed RNA polymerase subunit RPC12/RpoP
MCSGNIVVRRKKMIYVCGVCRFVFERIGEAEACPDCGKPNIREASRDEKNEYLRNYTGPGETGGRNGKEAKESKASAAL